MKFRLPQIKLDKSAGPVRRTLQYVFYDWTQGMPWSRRVLTTLGFLIQIFALYLALASPRKFLFMFLALIVYMVGICLLSGMLTSEFVRKTQLEADQIAAQQIQQTLHPRAVQDLPGYELAMFYKPLRDVGGDYFDIIQLPAGRTLFALADVSGKGMPAALLAANIQALVRGISSATSDLQSLADQVNRHLCRYTPPDRFATAIFALLSFETGELIYVNAGHNSPILASPGSVTLLESTGLPLGLIPNAAFECKRAVIPHSSTLAFYTDGLTDGIGGDEPEKLLCAALQNNAHNNGQPAISHLTSLVDPKFSEDDITILLLTRLPPA